MISIHLNVDIDLSSKSSVEIKEILGEISNLKDEDNNSKYNIETLSKKITSIFSQSVDSEVEKNIKYKKEDYDGNY